MKKLVVSFVAVLATIGIVSALAGLSVFKSFEVANPNNILSDETTYALPSFFSVDNSTKCPPGDFNLTTDCRESDSGKGIYGWELLLVNGTNSTNSTNTSIQLTHGNYNDSCSGNGCNKSIKTEIFVTSNYDGASTDWEHVGSVVSNPGSTATDSVVVSQPVDAIVVGRANAADSRPDPRWFLLEVVQ